jgi:predicted CopG family antitoxin
MSTTISGLISDDARTKLGAYKDAYELKNISDVLEHIIERRTIPTPVKKKEPDPNQTCLPGGEK